jgi:glycine/D-amino acid oxidase-like deaminating enzyme
MKQTPYWTDNTPRPEDLSSKGTPTDVDVAIVGSGYTGFSAAIEIAKAGLSVAVFEKETIGWGASSRNGGLMVVGLSVTVDQLEKRYGKESAKAFYKWSRDSIDFVERLVKKEKIDCDLDRSGEIFLASKPSHYSYMVGNHRYMNDEYGVDDAVIIPPNEVNDEIGSPIYHGGILDKGGAGIDPAKYLYGLAGVSKKYGVQIYENAEVNRIKKGNGSFRVTTPKGETLAKDILIATNGYTTSMRPRLRFGVFPGACYSIVTEPLSASLQEEISPMGRVFHDSKYYLNYFRVLADGRVLLGGRNTLVRGHDLNRSANELQNRLVEIFPQLEGVEITHSWSGNLGLTFDRMPHIGCLDGIHYAYGYMGHGVSVASQMGYEAGQIISGKRDSSLFKEIKHPRYFISVFDRLYFPVVCAWFRLMDRIK